MHFLNQNELLNFCHGIDTTESKTIFRVVPRGFRFYYRVSSADIHAAERYQPSFEDLLEELVRELNSNADFVCLVYAYHATSLVLNKSNWLHLDEEVKLVAIQCTKRDLSSIDPNPDFVSPLDRSWWIANLTDSNEVLLGTNQAISTWASDCRHLIFHYVNPMSPNL